MTSSYGGHHGLPKSGPLSAEPSVISQPGNGSNTTETSAYTSDRDFFLGQESNRTQARGHSSDSDNEGSRSSAERPRRWSRDHLLERPIDAGTALPQIDDSEQAENTPEKDISWRDIPRKDQLLVLTLSRLAEPLTQTSLGSYLYYQLQSFDPSLPASTIASQAGMIQASFPAAQFLTAILWGRFADHEYGGRKRVIYIGLLGTMLSIIGFGFSHNFAMAVAFRSMGGILNGNIGVMRTMISEIVKEKKYQSRAFNILPMTFNIGVIIGPILGGLLANPVASYPSVFGPGSLIGGKDGVQWMTRWPYALPNLMSAVFLFTSAMAVILFLEETSELCKHKPDPGLRIGHWIRRHIFRQDIATEVGYTAVPEDEYEAASSLELQPSLTAAPSDKPSIARVKLPFRRIWTRNLIITLCAHGFLAMHAGGFNSLWYIYLSAPRFDPSNPQPPGFKPHGFYHFTGGLALPPPRIGLAGTVLGVIGITMQLFLYPKLSHKLGTAKSYRIFTSLFPITYALVPFLSKVPSWNKPPAGVSGPLIWITIIIVLSIQVTARTFALPCTAILVNNVCPHPSVLGTVHGLGQSVSSFARTFGPIIFSRVFGKGLDIGIVGLAWWLMASVAILGFLNTQFVKEGDGHEILMEGEVKGKDGVVTRVE